MGKRCLLLDIDYETQEERAVIRLFLREGDKTLIGLDPSFAPYFYVLPTGDIEEVARRIREAPMEGRIAEVVPEGKRLLGKDVKALRVVVKHPQDVPKIRERIKELEGVSGIYEHDILFVRRYLIDRGLSPLEMVEVEGEEAGGLLRIKKVVPAGGEPPQLKVMALDTEVYNPKGAPRREVDPIIMVSLAASTGLRKVLTWKAPPAPLGFVEVMGDEAAILKGLERVVAEEDPDILVGYNTDNFDFPYIVERLKKLNLKLVLGRDGSEVRLEGRTSLPEARIRGRPHLDIYPIIRRQVRLNSYVLENVVKALLGREKEKLPGEDLWRYWDEGRGELVRFLDYSMEDATVTLELSERFLPLYYTLTRLVKQPLQDVARMTAGQLVEWLLMREASGANELLPNRAYGEEFAERMEETYAGGYVKEPKKGISEYIAVFDFRSLYPSVIVTHNIDPSTLVPKGGKENVVPGLEYSFAQERVGFIPSILKGLIERRRRVKEKMKGEGDPYRRRILDVEQTALKLLANSFYGYMGYPRARWYKRECAESVAAFARMYIKKVMAIAEEEFGFEVVYGDTDSLFLIVPKERKDEAMKFLERVNRSLPGIIELDFEGYYRRGIFVTKKRYALIDEQGKVTVKGLEFVRRDWAPIAKRTQERVLGALLRDASPEKAASIVREVIEDIKQRRITLEDITIYTQLTKGPESYKNLEPHAEAAKKLRKRGVEIHPGMIIGYVITKGTGLITKRAEPVEFAKLEDYDPEYYIENQILPAVLRIIEAMGYTKDYLKEGVTQEDLSKWF